MAVAFRYPFMPDEDRFCYTSFMLIYVKTFQIKKVKPGIGVSQRLEA